MQTTLIDPALSPGAHDAFRGAESRHDRLATMVVILACLAWSAAAFPTPEELLADSDHGYQLAAAVQILAGEHPFVDFNEVYGPFVFYASALGQWLSGQRVLGEFLLVLVGFAATYALLFRLMLAGQIPRRWALATALVAVALIPNAYKYYMVLGPVVFIWTLWRYLATPTWIRLGIVALAVDVAGLFRPDIGVYATLAALVGIIHYAPTWPLAVRRSGVFVGAALLVSTPWLWWLGRHDALGRYLTNSSVDAVKMAIGMSLPIPDFDFSAGLLTFNNAKAYLLRLPYVLVAGAAVALVVRWRTLPRTQQAGLLAVLAYAALSLLQASHRTSWGHVRDMLPLVLLLVAWATWGQGRSPRLGTMVLAAGCATLLVGIARYNPASLAPAAVGRKFTVFAQPCAAVIEDIRRHSPHHPDLALVDIIKQQSPAGTRVFTLFGLPNLNYFSGRLFAGGQMAVYPGYFSTREDQETLIARLQHETPAVVMVPRESGFDDRPERALEQFAPLLCSFLETHFAEVSETAGMRVLTPRRDAVAVAATKAGQLANPASEARR